MLVLVLPILFVSATTAAALTVQITSGGITTTLDPTAVGFTPDGQRAIFLAPPPGQGSTTYGNVSISSCTTAVKCSGLAARVVLQDGLSLDTIELTDAAIRANVAGATVTIDMRSDPGDFPTLKGNIYPYATSVDGRFTGVGATFGNLQVSAFANADDVSGPRTLIKNGGSTVEPSMAVPGFANQLTAEFFPPTPAEQTTNITCGQTGPIITSIDSPLRRVRHVSGVRSAYRAQRFLSALGRSGSRLGLFMPAWAGAPDDVIPAQASTSPDCLQSLQAMMTVTFRFAGDQLRLPGSLTVAGATSLAALRDGLAFRDKWTLDPAQHITAIASVQPPIASDGSSVFNAKRGVIPVKFGLALGPTPAILESIRSDTDTTNDRSSLTFNPGFDAGGNLPRTKFSNLTTLSANYLFTAGDCTGGSLRWDVVIDPRGDSNPSDYRTIHILYGRAPASANFACTGADSQSGTNLIGLTDARYDAFEVTGSHALLAHDAVLPLSPGPLLSTIGNSPVVRASLVLESPTVGTDLLLNLNGATVVRNLTLANGTITTLSDTFEPQSGNEPTCDLPPASIRVAKFDPTASNFDQVTTIDSIQSDTGTEFRIVDCKYMYNLDVRTLSGPGKYRVEVVIDDVDPAPGLQPLEADGLAIFGLK